MFGKNTRVNPLDARKRLLVAESELNRAQLVQDWRAMAGAVGELASSARAVGSAVSMAGRLFAGLFRHKKTAPDPEKPSWLQTILKGAQLASSLWSEFRSHRRE